MARKRKSRISKEEKAAMDVRAEKLTLLLERRTARAAGS
jgi:hypothetical protein